MESLENTCKDLIWVAHLKLRQVVVAGVVVVSSGWQVGAHLSIAGGLHRAVESLVEKGGNCLQIFSSSPRMWQGKELSKEEAEKFREVKAKHKIQSVFIHAKYLVNLASDKQELVEKSRNSLIYDMKVAEMIKADGVIVHLGSHLGRGFGAVKGQLVKEIKSILRVSSGRAMLLIENSAGQKGKIASQLGEIRLLLKSVNSPRLGWCLDTCHAWTAGYFSGKSPVNSLIQNDIVEEIEKLKILKKLKVLHVNDSRDKFGSGRDRHDNLGKGLMSKDELSAYVNHSMFKNLPMIIEVPGFEGKGPDKKNLDILKGLLG